tara:strand:+ start:13408 stop:13842 length:435 start_codon:yes stop_codon:yes gene_type:complete
MNDIIRYETLPYMKMRDIIYYTRKSQQWNTCPVLWEHLYKRMTTKSKKKKRIISYKKYVLDHFHERCNGCEKFPTYETETCFLCLSCMEKSSCMVDTGTAVCKWGVKLNQLDKLCPIHVYYSENSDIKWKDLYLAKELIQFISV